MKKEILHLLSDPSYKSTYWGSLTNMGVRGAAYKKGITINELDVPALEKMSVRSKNDVNSNLVIVNGATFPWLNMVMNIIMQKGLKCVLLSSGVYNAGQNVSVVTLSHEDTTIEMIRYLIKAGKQKIAFFAANPYSVMDQSKQNAFYKAAKLFNISFGKNDIYSNNGCLTECVRNFYNHIHLYNGIICSSDIAAICLIRYILNMGFRIPEDAYIMGFGNTMLGKLLVPSLTSTTLDYYDMGCQAVNSYLYLTEHTTVSYQTTVLTCKIVPRQSTSFEFADNLQIAAPVSTENIFSESNFYKDTSVSNLLKLEIFFQELDPLEYKLIFETNENIAYPELADRFFVSESTIKYHLRKMLHLSGFSSRQELRLFIKSQLGLEASSSTGISF